MHEQAIKNVMLLNAEQLRALRARVKETSKNRSSDEGSVQWQRWRDAGQEFHLRYDSLAFPGGLSVQWPKLIAGDPGTIDVAFCSWSAGLTISGRVTTGRVSCAGSSGLHCPKNRQPASRLWSTGAPTGKNNTLH